MHIHTKTIINSAMQKYTNKHIGCVSCVYMKNQRDYAICERTIFVYPCGTAFYNTTDQEVYRGGRCGMNYSKFVRKPPPYSPLNGYSHLIKFT